MKKNAVAGLVAILIAVSLSGCGASPYQQAKQDIARQYAELEQVQDMGLRQQKFIELSHREAMLEAQETRRQQEGNALLGAALFYQAQTQPKTYNVNFRGLR